MKILQINNNHFKLGGAETVYLNTIALLLENNHDVISLSRKSPYDLSVCEKEYFVAGSNSFLNKFYSRNAKQSLRAIIEKERPQLIHLHSIIGGITFSILPIIKKFGIPVVVTLHDFRLLCPASHFWNGNAEICEKCIRGKYYKCISNNCSPQGYFRSIAIATESYLRDYLIPYNKFINKFIFVSKFSKRKFLSANPLLETKTYIIYNFTKDFEQSKKRGDYFLFFGRLEPEKGIELLISAFKELPNLNLKIAGTGSLSNKIESMRLPNVELLGYKDSLELKEIIKDSSFIIVPSLCYENNPMSIVESFALGKPVIGSNLGGIVELITEGENGFKFETGNREKLLEVIKKSSLLNPKEYLMLSNNAYQFAIKNFTPEIHYNNLINVYSEALKDKI